ncbi:hypothetical protein FJP69_19735 [Stenotrophomonas maltophilia]|nr:hypothetical protein FJP69_19735 [Stenotrophomonas maltophilia]
MPAAGRQPHEPRQDCEAAGQRPALPRLGVSRCRAGTWPSKRHPARAARTRKATATSNADRRGWVVPAAGRQPHEPRQDCEAAGQRPALPRPGVSRCRAGTWPSTIRPARAARTRRRRR